MGKQVANAVGVIRKLAASNYRSDAVHATSAGDLYPWLNLPASTPGTSVNVQSRVNPLAAEYLGITHAACMVSLGFRPLGVHTGPGRVDQLNAGRLPIRLRSIVRDRSQVLARTGSLEREPANKVWRHEPAS
jgi:hypothetical protein